jgi:hypothetical protein
VYLQREPVEFEDVRKVTGPFNETLQDSPWFFMKIKKTGRCQYIYIYIYRLVQINGNKFATGQILKKPVEVVKGRILAG